MAVVALLPTGSLEFGAFAYEFSRLFQPHTFHVYPPERQLDGFTSNPVNSLVNNPDGPVTSRLEELAINLVESIFRKRRNEPRFDFAFVVEDVELANDHQPDLVIRLFRDAVDRYAQQSWAQADQGKIVEIRERCSFHLFRPMVEAYFFGDAQALQRAGAVRSPQLPFDLDLEQFCTVDARYRDLPENVNAFITDMPRRLRHPKSYLHYLCDPTTENKKARYRETRGGIQAFRNLNWEQVLSSAPHCPFLHALLDDVGQALNQRNGATATTPENVLLDRVGLPPRLANAVSVVR